MKTKMASGGLLAGSLTPRFSGGSWVRGSLVGGHVHTRLVVLLTEVIG